MSGGIFIDDTGTPGARHLARLLHPQRKSWAAVIVPQAMAGPLAEGMRLMLGGVLQDYGANELHLTDIYGGRGAFRGVTLEERHQLIELLVTIVTKLNLPIFFQTLSPEFLADIRARGFTASGRLGILDFSNHEHLAFFFLLSQVRDFITANREYFPVPLPVYVDEGMVKAGTVLKIDKYADVFDEGALRYSRSEDLPFLQVADFAAFVIGRTQWLLGRSDLKEHEKRFLRIVGPLHTSVMNLTPVPVDPDQTGPATYDAVLVEDRRRKGLTDYPPEVDRESESRG